MLILPAIDLLEGRCVRLVEGDYGRRTEYGGDPVAVAEGFAEAGAKWIHLVDLDAARGTGDNRRVIELVRRAVRIGIEVGGGVRTEKDVETLLDAGVDRLILGTIFARDPERVAAWSAKWGGRFIAGIDAREGLARTEGWTESSPRPDLELAEQARVCGLRGIIYTNIARDGTLAGPDIDRTEAVAKASRLPTLVSGGVSDLEDVHNVSERAPIAGLVVGRAVYEGRVDLEDLCRRYPQTEEEAGTW